MKSDYHVVKFGQKSKHFYFFGAERVKAVPPKTSESDIEKMSELDVKEKEKRDFALIEQLNTLTPLCPVVKKIKVKNKKNSVVPVQ